ncbi:MAG: formate/nitrite transporter family protein [Sphingomonadaceae bacterium]|nr:formate/nitrite transporter family protein [Sphingomonadaceae bacterium]
MAEDDSKPEPGLSDDELEAVAKRRSGNAKVVHEVIRLAGDEELDRPALSLLSSGFAAGVSICASVLAEAFLHQHLPDADWTKLVVDLGYTVGFVIAIMGNLQLFTENTITVVLPVATHPSRGNFARLARLWALAFVANMAGTLATMALVAHGSLIDPPQVDAAVAVARPLLDHDATTTLLRGIPAGFLIASIAWILPNARGSEFWVVFLITYVVAMGGFSHVVAGSAEAWLLWLSGKASLGWAVGGFILPALAGNIIGGTGLFAVLAHGQVREEINAD